MGSRLGYPSRQTIVVEPVKKSEEPIPFQAHFDEIPVVAEASIPQPQETAESSVFDRIRHEEDARPEEKTKEDHIMSNTEEVPDHTVSCESTLPGEMVEEKKEEVQPSSKFHKKKRHRSHKK